MTDSRYQELFLVEGEVEETQYMGRTTRYKDTRLVCARDAEAARKKFEAFWHDKTDEYCAYFSASAGEPKGVIF